MRSYSFDTVFRFFMRYMGEEGRWDLRNSSAVRFETFGIQETDENYILLSSKG